jgi:hypothetical protein
MQVVRIHTATLHFEIHCGNTLRPCAAIFVGKPVAVEAGAPLDDELSRTVRLNTEQLARASGWTGLSVPGTAVEMPLCPACAAALTAVHTDPNPKETPA